MNKNLNPILRTGSVLRVTDDVNLTPTETVRLGRRLFEDAKSLSLHFQDMATDIFPEIKTKKGQGPDLPPPRLRFSPTLAMDFPPNQFQWNGMTLETRSVVTICPGDTRGKLWLRLSFTDAEENFASVCDQKERLFQAAVPLKNVWLSLYNEICKKTLNKEFSSNYSLSVFMMSSDGMNENISKLLNEYSLAREGGLTQAIAHKILKAEFSNVAGIEIDDSSGLILGKKIVTYSFPRHQIVDVPAYSKPIEIVSDQDIKAVCAVNIRNDGTDVFGLGLEIDTPQNYRKSASHIASAEISYELGHIF